MLDAFIRDNKHKHSDPLIVTINDLVEVYLEDGDALQFPF
jgi:hypothetical protein